MAMLLVVNLSHAKELGVLELIDESPHYVVDSIVFGSANGAEVRVMLPKEAYEKQGLQSGYSLPREQFDYLMFHKCQEIVRENGGSVIQGFTVTEVTVEGKGAEWSYHRSQRKFWTKLSRGISIQLRSYHWSGGIQLSRISNNNSRCF